jgi:hypothetical protein
MGDTAIHFVSYDPYWVPADKIKAEAALSVVRQHCTSDFENAINIVETEHVEICLSPEDFNNVHCPRCNSILYVNDPDPEKSRYQLIDWIALVGAAYEEKFSDLSLQVPCCGLNTSFSDLIYTWYSVGFFRWSIKIDSPDNHFIPGFVIDEVEKLLEQKIKLVRYHL